MFPALALRFRPSRVDGKELVTTAEGQKIGGARSEKTRAEIRTVPAGRQLRQGLLRVVSLTPRSRTYPPTGVPAPSGA